MKLAQKLPAFQAGTLQEDLRLPAERLAELGVRGPARLFGPMVFERGATQSGQAFSTQGRVFTGAYSYMNEGVTCARAVSPGTTARSAAASPSVQACTRCAGSVPIRDYRGAGALRQR